VIERAVLLCAGAATRLRPLTDDRPKCLLDVGGETILARAVRLLLAAGVRKLVIATGYRQEDVRTALEACPAEVTFCHNADFARTQNAVSLHLCARALQGAPFFKLDGDVLFDRAVLERLLADPAPLSVAVERRDDLGDEEMKVLT
jgi:choline kinase